jgi:carboxymethylenebutenolidase
MFWKGSTTVRTKWIGIAVVLLISSLLTTMTFARNVDTAMTIESADVEVTSGGHALQSYLAAPTEDGLYPGIVLVHSFGGLEQGYRDIADQFAAHGFVVLAVGWQTVEQEPSDATMNQTLLDSIAFLTARADVDPERLGLTGFCACGYYTMLFLPQIDAFKAGVAWYGFPTRGEPSPIDLADNLTAPMLIIHGAADEDSPVAHIYEYAATLQNALAPFELKVYSGQPHGFMLSGGRLRSDEVAQDAFNQMVDFFIRKLG